MGLEWNESTRDWEWTGNVKGLVDTVGDGDARLGFVLDKKSGAKISMNIDGSDDPDATEPFYIESPDGDNLYDPSNRKEARMILSNIRAGSRYPDMPRERKPRKKKSASKAVRSPSLGGMRY